MGLLSLLIYSRLLLSLLICLLVTTWQRGRQPVWQRKTVGEWLVELRKARLRHRQPVPFYLPFPSRGATNLLTQIAYTEDINGFLHNPAAEALRALGTKAVQYLDTAPLPV